MSPRSIYPVSLSFSSYSSPPIPPSPRRKPGKILHTGCCACRQQLFIIFIFVHCYCYYYYPMHHASGHAYYLTNLQPASLHRGSFFPFLSLIDSSLCSFAFVLCSASWDMLCYVMQCSVQLSWVKLSRLRKLIVSKLRNTWEIIDDIAGMESLRRIRGST